MSNEQSQQRNQTSSPAKITQTKLLVFAFKKCIDEYFDISSTETIDMHGICKVLASKCLLFDLHKDNVGNMVNIFSSPLKEALISYVNLSNNKLYNLKVCYFQFNNFFNLFLFNC